MYFFLPSPLVSSVRFLVMDWIVFPYSFVEVLIHSVTEFEDRAFGKVIKVKIGHKGGVLIQCDRCPYEKGETPGMPRHREKATWGYSMKKAMCKPRRSIRKSPPHWHLDLRLPASIQNCEKIKSCCLSRQSMVFCYGSPHKLNTALHSLACGTGV